MILRALLSLCLALPGVAQEFSPNVPDAHTLHLWQFDEDGAPFADAGAYPHPMEGLLNGASAAHSSLPGLGKAMSFHANAGGEPGAPDLRGAILLARPHIDSGPRDNAPEDFRYFGPDGAFTYEAIVRFDILPHEAGVVACGLISMDGDGDDRSFNFRIEKEGFLSFIPLPHGGAGGLALATIPTSGPHAIDTTHWFHAAVSYDGNEGVPNNLKLYWTKLGPDLTEANRIGSGTLSTGFSGGTGDFAIGNEARAFDGNAEAEPFPGLIDEVRISGVARHPSDFFFVDPSSRISPELVVEHRSDEAHRPDSRLRLEEVLVDSSPEMFPAANGGALVLPPGLHRLDFDFGFGPDNPGGAIKLRCQLEGIDDRWQETERGMGLVCQALDKDGRVISQSRFPFIGTSDGWETTLEDSAMIRRVEPVYIPEDAVSLRLSLNSGSPDTTGFVTLDRLALTLPGEPDTSLWKNGSVELNETTARAAGVPVGWHRDGSDPAIARVVFRSGAGSLALVDGDQQRHGEWSSVQPISPGAGGVFVLSWQEAYNVSSGSLHRATYVNVPPGNYTFRVVGLAGENDPLGDGISLPIVIEPPFWRRSWFGPVLAAGLVALVAAGVVARLRLMAKRRVELLRSQNALERDRIRIARDLHDDLGTRVTVLNMTAALARRDIDIDPAKAHRHLDKMTDAAREMVVALDDLVWAVDPAHDTLDHLASHLTRLAEEMFRDSPVRCRLEIPSTLPARPLGAEFRHHLSLAVKESLHNVLQHAGACEVFLSMECDDDRITITIRDTGCGFDPKADRGGRGLGNTPARIREIGGSYAIDSSPSRGTCIVIICRLPKTPT
ncbi:histidine kinase [Luteolibacter flavescens]|uniref:Histidine kinase n=1 Tax=Luteolibacter flavescens TaxID=1859460 RepID=A0ABT3FSE8_9BACT|nr:histidine kinase [Luteolibacter flavescens]MCW1886508.1 histidine kinase [Luteolibacter flavescens]